MARGENKLKRGNGHTPQSPSSEQPNDGLVIQRTTASFSGPIPPPALLAQYNAIIPNGAERIMAMAEKQSSHRESLEAMVIGGNLASQVRGSYFAFIICMVAIIFGFVLIEQGRNVSGLVAIITAVGGIAATFVYAKHRQSKERIEKAVALQERKSGH